MSGALGVRFADQVAEPIGTTFQDVYGPWTFEWNCFDDGGGKTEASVGISTGPSGASLLQFGQSARSVAVSRADSRPCHRSGQNTVSPAGMTHNTETVTAAIRDFLAETAKD